MTARLTEAEAQSILSPMCDDCGHDVTHTEHGCLRWDDCYCPCTTDGDDLTIRAVEAVLTGRGVES